MAATFSSFRTCGTLSNVEAIEFALFHCQIDIIDLESLIDYIYTQFSWSTLWLLAILRKKSQWLTSLKFFPGGHQSSRIKRQLRDEDDHEMIFQFHHTGEARHSSFSFFFSRFVPFRFIFYFKYDRIVAIQSISMSMMKVNRIQHSHWRFRHVSDNIALQFKGVQTGANSLCLNFKDNFTIKLSTRVDGSSTDWLHRDYFSEKKRKNKECHRTNGHKELRAY